MTKSPYQVGQLLKLTTPCLYNEAGTVGVIYELYERTWRHSSDTDSFGISVIFPNGRHDGFSGSQQAYFLSPLGLSHDISVRNYKFIHVTQLLRDFHAGLFSEAFLEGLRLKAGVV